MRKPSPLAGEGKGDLRAAYPPAKLNELQNNLFITTSTVVTTLKEGAVIDISSRGGYVKRDNYETSELPSPVSSVR